MKLLYALNPMWANRSKTLIMLTVRFDHIQMDLPFTANQNDVEQHGRDIFARAVNGEFGEIAPFQPEVPTIEKVSSVVREARNYKLQTEIDPIVSNPLRWAELPEEKKQAFSNYRLALLNMTDDPLFPWMDKIVIEEDLGYVIDETLAPWPEAPND
jgi:hypothetical protein